MLEDSASYQREKPEGGLLDVRIATHRLGLYIEFNESFTGGPRLAANLVQSLKGSSIEPILFTNRESELTECVAQLGCKYHIVETPELLLEPGKGKQKRSVVRAFRSFLAILRLNRRLYQEFKRHDVDLVWTRNVKGVCFVGLGAWRQRVPLIWDVGMELPSRGLIFLLHLFGFCLSTAIVIQGKHVGEFVFDPRMLKFFRRKVEIVPSAVAPSRVAELKKLRNCRSVRNEVVNIVTVGTVNRRKDQLTLLRAFAKIANAYPHTRVLIAGPITDQDYGLELERFVDEHQLHDRVEFQGWVEDVPALLLSSDLFVMTSRNEGVPQAVMEAMIAGVPVVASRVGGIPDIVEHGRTGYLFDAGDVEELAKQLTKCLAAPQQLSELSDSAAEWIEQHRSLENWSRIYGELLNRLLHGGRAKS